MVQYAVNQGMPIHIAFQVLEILASPGLGHGGLRTSGYNPVHACSRLEILTGN